MKRVSRSKSKGGGDDRNGDSAGFSFRSSISIVVMDNRDFGAPSSVVGRFFCRVLIAVRACAVVSAIPPRILSWSEDCPLFSVRGTYGISDHCCKDRMASIARVEFLYKSHCED